MAESSLPYTPENEMSIFHQDDVFVHTAVTTSTFYDNIIRGQLCILKKEAGIFAAWKPLSDLTMEVDSDGPLDYDIVTTQKTDSLSTVQSYNIMFNVKEIHSIQRSDPRLAWSYVIFKLNNGTRYPALHFHNGGINEMISCLQRFIWLTRSSANQKHYIVQQQDEAMGSTMQEFELFANKPTDKVSKFFNNTYYGTLNGFSKVTQYVLGSIGQQELYEKRPGRASPVSKAIEEYEFLDSDEPDMLGPVIPVARSDPIQPELWCSFVNDDGSISDEKKLKEIIFRGGLHKDIKLEGWKFLLGYCAFDSTTKERETTRIEKCKQYQIMKNQWKTVTVEQESRFAEFAHRKQLIDKDTLRTDRTVELFEGDCNEHVQKLFDILMTYCMYNFDLGYVQGMSDLLSPVYQLMQNEVDAFWCFVGLMEIEQTNFEMSQHVMKEQLAYLARLIKYLYPNFYSFLENQESENLYFCFRWVLISFKRDFSQDDIMMLWEVLWTQTLTPHFKLFICLAILEREKDVMMKNNFKFNDILKHINELAYHIDLNYTLARAESICLQLRSNNDLPDIIKELVYYPSEKTQETECTSPSQVSNNSRTCSDSLVHLIETTESVF